VAPSNWIEGPNDALCEEQMDSRGTGLASRALPLPFLLQLCYQGREAEALRPLECSPANTVVCSGSLVWQCGHKGTHE